MPDSHANKKSAGNNGFSLVELLIVIAIIAILGTVLIGPMLRWRTNSMIESQVNTIMADLERAKMESIRRARNISVVFVPATNTYDVFVDLDGNMARYIDADNPANNEPLLFSKELSTIVSLTSSATNNALMFTPRGALAGTQSFILTVSPAANAKTSTLVRTITVNRIGNVTSAATE